MTRSPWPSGSWPRVPSGSTWSTSTARSGRATTPPWWAGSLRPSAAALGCRSLAVIEDAIGLGAARVVIGTGAVRDPTLVPAALARAGVERVAVGIDARDGIIAIRGWRETGGEQARDVARRVVDQGV